MRDVCPLDAARVSVTSRLTDLRQAMPKRVRRRMLTGSGTCQADPTLPLRRDCIAFSSLELHGIALSR
eukprot:15483425-Alexandrium_andersonii.AAC.1